MLSVSGDGPGAFKDALGATAALELFGGLAAQKGGDLTVAVVGTTNVSVCLAYPDCTM